MKWEKHQPRTRTENPASLTINCEGNMIFNAKAVKEIIKSNKSFELFFNYDDERNLLCVGFKLYGQKGDSRRNLSFRNANGRISQVLIKGSRKVASNLGVKDKTAMRFPISFDQDSKTWFIERAKGHIFSTSNYKQSKKK